ncbi:hypothetical protein AsAng_0037880 [Aureispira anguillae]|uniref:Uncharacterized protein n=1 Tax=Aureispira anguillae TaxID=2864201 RepID=A0A916DV18_9BACT|nr:hypothetical protein AsAng_0037880 [Aureispira anguillae]
MPFLRGFLRGRFFELRLLGVALLLFRSEDKVLNLVQRLCLHLKGVRFKFFEVLLLILTKKQVYFLSIYLVVFDFMPIIK